MSDSVVPVDVVYCANDCPSFSRTHGAWGKCAAWHQRSAVHVGRFCPPAIKRLLKENEKLKNNLNKDSLVFALECKKAQVELLESKLTTAEAVVEAARQLYKNQNWGENWHRLHDALRIYDAAKEE
jgi:hypothetical protein